MIQLKRLDKSRNDLIKKLRRRIRKMPLKATKSKRVSGKQVMYYGKPFSYYYNLIEKQNQE